VGSLKAFSPSPPNSPHVHPFSSPSAPSGSIPCFSGFVTRPPSRVFYIWPFSPCPPLPFPHPRDFSPIVSCDGVSLRLQSPPEARETLTKQRGVVVSLSAPRPSTVSHVRAIFFVLQLVLVFSPAYYFFVFVLSNSVWHLIPPPPP